MTEFGIFGGDTVPELVAQVLFEPVPTVLNGQVLIVDLAASEYRVLACDGGGVVAAGKAFQVDPDLLVLTRAGVALELMRTRTEIRKHRDMPGDDRCYQDDAALYAVLPEGDTRPERETAVTIENCARYIASRQEGREYVSPQRRIEELEAENTRLHAAVDSLRAAGEGLE